MDDDCIERKKAVLAERTAGEGRSSRDPSGPLS
jgi:hypothetical protein